MERPAWRDQHEERKVLEKHSRNRKWRDQHVERKVLEKHSRNRK